MKNSTVWVPVPLNAADQAPLPSILKANRNCHQPARAAGAGFLRHRQQVPVPYSSGVFFSSKFCHPVD